MKNVNWYWVFVALLCLPSVGEFQDAGAGKAGRPVVVAASAIGYRGDYDQKMALALGHLHAAGQAGADILCLPEEFSGGPAEPVPGPTTDAVAALAEHYGMYVICPVRERDGDREYNTAVLIDRAGRVAGYYRKIFVFWSEDAHAGDARVPFFDTDFGRISLLNCFDINFPELWQEAERNGTEILFWPSAFGGGFPLRGYAGIHAYYVVSVGDGDFIDMTGEPIAPDAAPLDKLHITTLDLDRTLVHKDYTRDKVAALVETYADTITLERDWHPEGWFMLRAVKPGVRVRDLCRRYDIETLREYRRRSREQINARRNAGAPVAADPQGAPLPRPTYEHDVPAWIRAFAGRLNDAWRHGLPMPQLSAAHPEATLADAYRIQWAFVDLMLGTDGIGGFKAAGVASLDENSPLIAVMPASEVLLAADTIVIDLRDAPPRHVETEIGYVFKKAITNELNSVEELKAHVAAVAAIVEVPGNPVESFQPGTGEDLVAWNINAKAMIVGELHDPNSVDPDAVAITFERDGVIINTARGDMAAAGQWPTLLKTVNHAIQAGYVIEADHIITNGALGSIVRAEPGTYRADFGALGTITFEAR